MDQFPHKKPKKIHTLVVAFSLCLALTLTTTAIVLAQTNNTPLLKVVTPSEDQTIYTDSVPILFSVENFNLVDYQSNPAPMAGQGHLLLWLDDPSPTLESATILSQDHFTYSDVAYGQHTLKAELVTNNNLSLTPPVVVTVKFKNAPASTPSPAAASGFDKNTALVILVVVALVIVAAWWYTKEEDIEVEEKAKTKTKKTTKVRRKKP